MVLTILKVLLAHFGAIQILFLPDLLSSDIKDDEWLTTLLEILKDQNIKVLFPGVDFELELLAKYKAQIEQENRLYCYCKLR